MTYASEVLADSPKAFYTLDQTTGNWLDTSGNALDIAPGTGMTRGKTGIVDDGGASVSGSGTGTIGHKTTGIAGLTGVASLECWIRTPAGPVSARGGFVKIGGNGNGWTIGVGNNRNDQLGDKFTIGINGLNWYGTGIAFLPSTSYHCVVTYNGTNWVAYINGVGTALGTLQAPNAPSQQIHLGDEEEAATAFLSSWIDLDNVAVYTAALSAARVLAHYSAGIPPVGPTARGSAQSEGSAVATISVGPIPANPIGHGESSASAAVVPIHGGVTRNRVGGRRRNGIGEAVWEPPVVPPPSTVPNDLIRLVAHAFGPVTMDGTVPTYTVQQVEQTPPRDRIIIGGVDVTYFRGAPTPFPGFGLVEPLLYGPTQITFPQIAGAFEKPGVGALKWCRPGAPVVIQRVNNTTDLVESTDYRGLVVGYDYDGPSLAVQIGGEATGRAAMQNRQPPIFPRYNDLGFMAYHDIMSLGLKFKPYLGPDTGIRARSWGGTSMLDHIHAVVAGSWNRDGNRWTIMPDSKGVYRMKRKDTTTIHGTVYADDSRTLASLHRDTAEEPNRIFMTGVTPEGQRVRFGAYPGMKQTDPPPYPMNDDSDFGQGTTDGDTDTGDGISVMVGRLIVVGYLDLEDRPGGYDGRTTKAIRNLQRDAGLPVTGDMSPDGWRALYDLSVTGFSLSWSRILPAAERSEVRQWRRSPSGAIMGRNPGYRPLVPKRDRNVDAGTGFTRPQLREWARAELEDGESDNYTGTVTFKTGALIAGDHTPGDPITEADLMPARDVQPGWNLRLPLFNGDGIVVHVSAVTVSSAGEVSATVDTRARDAQEVWEVIERRRESRRSPYREWVRDHRASTVTKDAITPYDEVGGILGDNLVVPGFTWTVFPVVAGQEGTIQWLRTRTNPDAEYVMAVFGKRIGAGRLAGLIGNPLTRAGSKRWANETVRDDLRDKNLMLYVAGSDEEPLGYFPKTKTSDNDDDTADAPLTGRWEDEAGFAYYTRTAPLLWVAVYTDRDTHIPQGRIMRNQLEAGA